MIFVLVLVDLVVVAHSLKTFDLGCHYLLATVAIPNAVILSEVLRPTEHQCSNFLLGVDEPMTALGLQYTDPYGHPSGAWTFLGSHIVG